MKTNAMPIRILNLLKISLYNTSVLFLVITLTLEKLIIDLLKIQIDIAVKVHHIIVLIIEILPHIPDFAPFQ